MRESTDALIQRLSTNARPVKPLLPPYIRAASLLVPVLVAFTVIAALWGDPALVYTHLSDPAFAANFLGSLPTGICLIIAGINSSIPGRSASWAWLPLPPAIVWLTGSAVQCYRHIQAHGFEDTSIFSSADCFVFIMMAGTPIALCVFMLLRRSVTTNLVGVTSLTGVGAAAIAGALLCFFHPPGTHPVDFITHIAATGALMLFMATLGRSALEQS